MHLAASQNLTSKHVNNDMMNKLMLLRFTHAKQSAAALLWSGPWTRQTLNVVCRLLNMAT